MYSSKFFGKFYWWQFAILFSWTAIYFIFLHQQMKTFLIQTAHQLNNVYASSERGLDLDPISKDNILVYSNQNSNNTYYSIDKYTVNGQVNTIDPRTNAMRKFLQAYNSPMEPYAENIVKEADKNQFDWRLLVSISGVESAFGNLIPINSFNGWGWRGDPTRDFSAFKNWPDAITQITEGIATGYGKRPNPFVMVTYYCPPCSVAQGLPWPNAVTGYMVELDQYLKRELK